MKTLPFEAGSESGAGGAAHEGGIVGTLTGGAEHVVERVEGHLQGPKGWRLSSDNTKQAAGILFVASIVMIVAILLITNSPIFSTVFYMLFGTAGAIGLVVFAKKSITEYKEEKKQHKEAPGIAGKPSLWRSLGLTPKKGHTVG